MNKTRELILNLGHANIFNLQFMYICANSSYFVYFFFLLENKQKYWWRKWYLQCQIHSFTNKQTNKQMKNASWRKAGETTIKIHYHKYSLPNNAEEKTGNMKYIFIFFFFSKLFYQKQRWHHEVTDTEAVNGAEGTSQGWEGSRLLGERLLGWFGCWFLCSVESWLLQESAVQ